MLQPSIRLASRRWATALRPTQQATRQPCYAYWYSTRYSQPGTRSSSRAEADSLFQTADVQAAAVSNAPNHEPGHDPYVKDPEAERAKRREQGMKRLRFASYGLFFSVLATGGVVYKLISEVQEEEQRRSSLQTDASSDSNAKFQGRPVHVIGAGEDKRIITEDNEQVELVETGTSSVPFFPRVLYLPSSDSRTDVPAPPNSAINPGNIHNNEEYTLIGLGIRTVSVFSIQVYVLGLYVRTADLSGLQARLIHYVNKDASTLVPSEKDDLRQAMLDPTRSTEIWDELLRSHIKTAWRISPTRNTDFAHLRDGWITGIKRGTQAAAAAIRDKATGPVETEYESESFGEAVKQFKSIFDGQGKTPKGSVVTLVRDQQGSTEVLFEDPSRTQGLESIGKVTDPRISKLIWLGYMAGKKVSSEAARKGVADGCLILASRPVGSAETMVN
ncbi:hypothetical protein K461DRAFT_95610 [Myriangium duriaei CBS 260.36]|uniref:Chalcone isomerase domain-containing protein n=1 Tax=Myriangium duriaei CBS 260.36 TaxID=1168546 RepID=A0A9P4J6S7_9PEZI|nr:hypothetical protein K461DRAFT_95610 [Myriangium duriaei CBS 260.36]